MMESGGAKFLRLLESLIEETRTGRIQWERIEGEAARDATHDRVHPGDEYGSNSFEGAYTSIVGSGIEVVLRPLVRDCPPARELIVATVDHGRFGLRETDRTADLFADLCFLVAGGGDRQEALDAALEGVKP